MRGWTQEAVFLRPRHSSVASVFASCLGGLSQGPKATSDDLWEKRKGSPLRPHPLPFSLKAF